MLKIAKSKKIYKKLIQESLSKKTTLRSNQFDVVLCTGVLTSGHVGAKAINELIRVTKNRGYLILSIAESIYEKLGFKNEIEKNNFQISKVKISKPFIALPNHESSATSKMHIYQRKLA
jgi:ubiquinone/menaquinone biosynthesis C-methylase UbiE